MKGRKPKTLEKALEKIGQLQDENANLKAALEDLRATSIGELLDRIESLEDAEADLQADLRWRSMRDSDRDNLIDADEVNQR